MPSHRTSRDPGPPSGDARLALLLILAILCPLLLIASAPDWWSTRGVLQTGAAADDYAVLNQGQLKNLATAAVAEFNDKLVGGAGADLTQMVASWQNGSVPRDDYAAVNVGQLKALAARFYDRLGQPYPWTGSPQPADDYALANIGQAKALFSFTVPTVFHGIVADPLWQTLQDILNGSFTGYLTAAQYAALLDLVQRMNEAAFIAALNAALAQANPSPAAQQIAAVLAQAQSEEGTQRIAQTPVLSSTPLAAGDDGLRIERFWKRMSAVYAENRYPDPAWNWASFRWYFGFSPWTGQGHEWGFVDRRADIRTEFESPSGTANSYYVPGIIWGPTILPWEWESTSSTYWWANDAPRVDDDGFPYLSYARGEDRRFARFEFKGAEKGADNRPQVFSGSRTYLTMLRDYSDIVPGVLGMGSVTFTLASSGNTQIIVNPGTLDEVAGGILTTDEHTWLEMRIPVPSSSLAELDNEGVLEWRLDLLPIEFESETAKDSGVFYKLPKKLPVFGADSGINRGVQFSTVSSPAQLNLPSTFSTQTLNSFSLSGPIVGNQTLAVSETSSGSRIFRDSQGSYEIDLTSLGSSSPSAVTTLSFKVRHSGQETLVVMQRGTSSQQGTVPFSETPVATEINRTPLSPDDNHDGVIYLRLADLGDNSSVKVKSGGNEVTLNWQTVASGARELEPFILLPASGPSVSTTIKTLRIAAAAVKVTFFLVAAGQQTQIAEEWVARPPFLACSLNGEINAKNHLEEIDYLIGRKGSTGMLWWKKETPPPLGWANSLVDEQLTLAEFQAEVSKHELFYLMAHGTVRDATALQDWGFVGVGLYDPATKKTDHVLTPAEVSTANAANPHYYELVFLNSCAGADQSEGTPRQYWEAFEARNYVSWDKPTLFADAATGAKRFFQQLDGGEKVKNAVNGISGGFMSPVTLTPLAIGQTNLTALKTDDESIIDQTP